MILTYGFFPNTAISISTRGFFGEPDVPVTPDIPVRLATRFRDFKVATKIESVFRVATEQTR